MANYANNYKGICLQYNIEYDLTFFDNLQVINYEKNLDQIEFNPSSNWNSFREFFYTKSENWHYEFEIRLLKEKVGKFYHKKEALRSVILGYNIEPTFRDKIIKIVKENYNNTKIFQLIKPEKINTLTFIPIK